MAKNSITFLFFILFCVKITYSEFNTEDLFQTRDFITPIFKSIKRNRAKEEGYQVREGDDDTPKLEPETFGILQYSDPKDNQSRSIDLITSNLTGNFLSILFLGGGHVMNKTAHKNITVQLIRNKEVIENYTINQTYQMITINEPFSSDKRWSLKAITKGKDRERVGVIFKVTEGDYTGTNAFYEYLYEREEENSTYLDIHTTVWRRDSRLEFNPITEAEDVYGIWARSDRDEYNELDNHALLLASIDASHDKFYTRHGNSESTSFKAKTHRGSYHANVFGIVNIDLPGGKDTFPMAVSNHIVHLKVEQALWKIVLVTGIIAFASTGGIIIVFNIADKFCFKGDKQKEALTKFQQEEQKLKKQQEEGQAPDEPAEQPTTEANPEGKDSTNEKPQ